MKVKTLICAAFAGCIWSSIAFAQTIQVKGTVCSFDDTKIVLQCGPDTWTIKRTATTKVISGTLKVGNVVTVECTSPDAQRKEGVTTCTPAPTPTATATPTGG
jgi:hypothetical protein